ncbi:hypothetical protein [Streptomyces sp. NRRL S-146]|uniref:hypothetical protein n=1 Tax=Streptomyces sp. NRRL S-146 TaxID=1463884 RepID=UPI00099CBD8A|nr:hypothetical protein [Streptomyces sp. NRRL S-146]
MLRDYGVHSVGLLAALPPATGQRLLGGRADRTAAGPLAMLAGSEEGAGVCAGVSGEDGAAFARRDVPREPDAVPPPSCLNAGRHGECRPSSGGYSTGSAITEDASKIGCIIDAVDAGEKEASRRAGVFGARPRLRSLRSPLGFILLLVFIVPY